MCTLSTCTRTRYADASIRSARCNRNCSHCALFLRLIFGSQRDLYARAACHAIRSKSHRAEITEFIHTLQKATLDGLEPQLRRRVERICRGTLRPHTDPAAAAAADAPAMDETAASIIDAAPALAPTAGHKDRRKKGIRELDERAHVIVAQLQASRAQADLGHMAIGKRGRGKGKLQELVSHPALFPTLLKVGT